ncbi:hypothetical protein MCS25_03785 [Porphyromonas gingivalis]|uniref:hypothetical protein n=1 Tax=Porphyromonas gingivalis TaxID=837 RepID=UPI0005C3D741|nr:hypothetical protein [Porphyromonas gingivalis]ATR98031.1 hypothetical protein CS550_01830 [Porphyromonas gingivalis]ATR98308.1 hypothetical protein CS550_03435 [Porphyromonas gingivalis]USI94807.1 hypothetical protein MCS24_04230 [Porphyromonas gingivalis]USI96627.1 hypothetical protein MCS27_03780 [Porphyromonas gingivalis]USI98536.1 hypothetical protein MCS25_03785 [Porphyromonas gingivalis]
MNRVYNNEAIIMACIVHLLRRRNMDMPISYIMVTLLIDNQLGAIIRKSQNFEELSDLISKQGLISRKLASFGPYFINAMVILKQSKVIAISGDVVQLIDYSFPDENLRSKRLERIINDTNVLLDMCSNLSSKEIYNKLNVQL